jgi:phage/plasmid-like protein (TIGR03299 family)
MAHQVETMAYAGDVPWHRLGRAVSSDMTPDEMVVAAGLDWMVSKRPAYTTADPSVTNLFDPTSSSKFLFVPDQHFLVRDSDNSVLSPAGKSYVPFQNREVMQFFKKFTDAGQMKMETAGSLKEGRDIWGLAKLAHDFKLPGGDEVKGYMLLNNSHQVGKALTVMLTTIRVVCANTLGMALGADGDRFRVLHLQMFDEEIMQAAEEALGLSTTQMKQFQEQAEFLSKKRAKNNDVEKFIADLFQPNLLVERGKMADNLNTLPPLRDEFKRTASNVMEAIEISPGASLTSSKGTWWGVLNGVTYVQDHQKRSTSPGNALHSAWFGAGAVTKRKALNKVLEYAKVA